MALLDMCMKKGIPVSAAHVNYHHRLQAEEEEEYLRTYCHDHDIPLFVRNEPFVQQGNFEADAREWRYEFFVKTVKENGFAGVLIAHQEDDLLETYLMQKERNLVPAWYGLQKEMLYEGIRVVRPLLEWTKADLQTYCDHNGVKYYIDATNQDLHITRNRIRHEIVENLTRKERDALLAEIKRKNEEKGRIEENAEKLLKNHKINITFYRKSTDKVRETALRELLDPNGGRHLSLAFIQEIDQVIMHHRDFMIPYYDQYVVTDQNHLFLWSVPDPYEDHFNNLEDIISGKHDGYLIEEGKHSVNAVTVKKEDFPLTIRNFHDGDAVEMRFGTKQVSRFFVDRRIPLFKRKNWPIVENCRHEVILVPGLGCDRTHYSPKPTFNVIQYTQIEEKDCTCGKKKT